VYSVSSDTLVRLASGLSEQSVSTFASPESVQELQGWDKSVTNNWGEKGGKNNTFTVLVSSAVVQYDTKHRKNRILTALGL
jgi:hypothetical protein